MKNRFLFLSFITFLLIPGQLFSQKKATLPLANKDAVVEKLSGDFSFTEGPTADREGNVYFTDQPNNRILKWGTDGKISTYLQPAGRSNGMCFDRNGFLWTCAEEKNEVWKISPDKKVEVVAKLYNDKVFNGPNDIWVSPSGGVYFSDPFFRREWWDHTAKPQEKERVYYLAPESKTPAVVIDDMVRPNGIIGTPDGKTLFVSDMGGKKTYSYTVNADGTLGNKKLFCNFGSDGITIDEKGNIYMTGSGVTVFDKTGTEIGKISVPEKWTANVCFGGKDRKTLFITASASVYTIRMKVRGAASQ
jgi:gluconolactonase